MATLLSGVTYLILKNPEAYQTLVKEVRSAFNSEEEINLLSVAKLPYMLACLDEALRMYPPGAVGPPRVTPKGGAEILGARIPARVFAIRLMGPFMANIGCIDIRFDSSLGSLSTGGVFLRSTYFPPGTIPPGPSVLA